VPDFSLQSVQALLACFQHLSASTEMSSAPIQEADVNSAGIFSGEDTI
jgi:hypothetical protein